MDAGSVALQSKGLFTGALRTHEALRTFHASQTADDGFLFRAKVHETRSCSFTGSKSWKSAAFFFCMTKTGPEYRLQVQPRSIHSFIQRTSDFSSHVKKSSCLHEVLSCCLIQANHSPVCGRYDLVCRSSLVHKIYLEGTK